MGPLERTESQRAVAKVLEEVAAEVGAPNIQAGERHSIPSLSMTLTKRMLSSGDRIRDAEDAICVPHSRRSQGRAAPGEYRGARRHTL